MKHLFFLINILCITSLLNAQQLTVGGIEDTTLFIGISNKIEYHHSNYSVVKMTLNNNNCHFRNDNCYCSKEGKTTLLISDTLNKVIDSFTLTIKNIQYFGVCIKLNDGALIKPIQHISKQQIQEFYSLYCAHNVPWVNISIDAYDFTLLQNDEVFSFTIQKNRMSNEMKFLLPKIEKGAKIYIDNLKIRIPGDCNNSIFYGFDLNVN